MQKKNRICICVCISMDLEFPALLFGFGALGKVCDHAKPAARILDDGHRRSPSHQSFLRRPLGFHLKVLPQVLLHCQCLYVFVSLLFCLSLPPSLSLCLLDLSLCVRMCVCEHVLPGSTSTWGAVAKMPCSCSVSVCDIRFHRFCI